MYWTDIPGDRIVRSNLDGSGTTVIVNTGLCSPCMYVYQ